MKTVIKLLTSVLCVALLATACEKEQETEDTPNPFEGADNHVTSFVLKKGEITYVAAITAGTITVTVPVNVNLNGATAEYRLCENAKILPDPAGITDWDSEHLFRVTAWNGTETMDYLYTVEKSDLVRDGAVILKTQAEVDAFGQGSYTVINGYLAIGATSGTDTIKSLVPLSSLKTVTGSIIINAMYMGDLTGFEQLETVGELQVLSKNVKTVRFPKLTTVRMNMGFDQYTSSTSFIQKGIFETLDFPELTAVERGLRIYYADSLATMNFPKLERVMEDIIVEGNSTTNFLHLQTISFPALTAVGGAISLKYVSGVETFTATKLETAGTLSVENCTALAGFDCPALETLGDLSILTSSTSPLTALPFPALTTIEGTLSITLPDLTSLELPSALKNVGMLNLTLAKLTSLTLPSSLKVGTLNAADLRKLDSFDVSSIEELGALSFGSNTLQYTSGITLTGDEVFPGRLIFNLPTSGNNPLTIPVTVEGIKVVGALEIPVANNQAGINAVKTIDFSWLEQVTGLLRIDRLNKLETLNLSNLQSVGGLRLTGLLALKTLNLSKLETVTADGLNFINWWSDAITTVSLSELTSVAGDLSFTGMDDYVALTTISFPSLTSITGTLIITGDQNYPIETLTTIGFDALTSAGGVTISKIKNLKNFCPLLGIIPLSDPAKWSVTDCGYNPTHAQMENGNCNN
jgi:hypothetical protein